MPRKKQWKRSVIRKTEWKERARVEGEDGTDRERSRTDWGDMDSTDRYERPPARGAGSPSNVVAGSPSNVVAGSPSNVVVGSPSNVVAGNKDNTWTNSQNISKMKQIEVKSEHANINQFKQAILDVTSLVANVSSNLQTDFETVFLDTFPDINADYQSSVIKESPERESITFRHQNTMPQATQYNDYSRTEYCNSDSLQTCLDNDIVCYEAVRSSEPLWNKNNC